MLGHELQSQQCRSRLCGGQTRSSLKRRGERWPPRLPRRKIRTSERAQPRAQGPREDSARCSEAVAPKPADAGTSGGCGGRESFREGLMTPGLGRTLTARLMLLKTLLRCHPAWSSPLAHSRGFRVCVPGDEGRQGVWPRGAATSRRADTPAVCLRPALAVAASCQAQAPPPRPVPLPWATNAPCPLL